MPTTYAANITIDGTELGRRRGAILAPRARTDEERIRMAARYFETSVATALGELGARDTGRAVLRAIDGSPRRLTIVPYFGGSKDNPNATARPTHPRAARRRGLRPRDASGQVTSSTLGTGQGSDSVVEFLPPQFARHVPGIAVGAGPGSLRDEVLLHELVHALRHLRGLRTHQPVRFQRTFTYDNREEFYAILIANIYRSECGRAGLRHDHSGFDPMFVASADFLKLGRNRAYLRRLRREMPALFRALRGVRAEFNPTAFLA